MDLSESKIQSEYNRDNTFMILSQVDINTFEKELDDELNQLMDKAQPNFDSFCGLEDYLDDDNGTDIKPNKPDPNFPLQSLETVPGYAEFLDSTKKVQECIAETFQSVKQLEDALPISAHEKLSLNEEEKVRIGFDFQSELISLGDKMVLSNEKKSSPDQTNDHFAAIYEENLLHHYDQLNVDLETCHHELERIKDFKTNFHEEVMKEAVIKKSRLKIKHLAIIQKRLNAEEEEKKLIMKKANEAKRMLSRNRMKNQAFVLYRGLCRIFLSFFLKRLKNKCKSMANKSIIIQKSNHFDCPARIWLYHLQIYLKKLETFFQNRKQVINIWTEGKSFYTYYYPFSFNYIRPTFSLKNYLNPCNKLSVCISKSMTYHISRYYLDKRCYKALYLMSNKSKHMKCDLNAMKICL